MTSSSSSWTLERLQEKLERPPAPVRRPSLVVRLPLGASSTASSYLTEEIDANFDRIAWMERWERQKRALEMGNEKKGDVKETSSLDDTVEKEIEKVEGVQDVQDVKDVNGKDGEKPAKLIKRKLVLVEEEEEDEEEEEEEDEEDYE